MERADIYKANADQSDRLAERSANEAERLAYWRIAQGWRELEAAARAAGKRG